MRGICDDAAYRVGAAAWEVLVIERPDGVGAFEFITLATLRTAQLMRGCAPRIEGPYKRTTIAQLEVAEGMVTRQVENAEQTPGVDGETS